MCKHPSLMNPTAVYCGKKPLDVVASLIGKVETAIGNNIVVDNDITITDHERVKGADNAVRMGKSCVDDNQKRSLLEGLPKAKRPRLVSNSTLHSLASSDSKHAVDPHNERVDCESPLLRRHCRSLSESESALVRTRGAPIVVEHHYHDYSNAALPPEADTLSFSLINKKVSGGISAPFPKVLHELLDRAESEGYGDCISWQPHGRSFKVHDQERFVSEVMAKFFKQTRFSSFQRQLSLYGFLRMTRKGPDRGSYYHELFLRGLPNLASSIQRKRVKGYWVRQASSPETEPDFYTMPGVGVPEPSPIVNSNGASSPVDATTWNYDGSIKMAYLGSISPSTDNSERSSYPQPVRSYSWDDLDLSRQSQSYYFDPLQISEELRESEQQELAEFLVGVNLDSSKPENDGADEGEDELFRIYSMVKVRPRVDFLPYYPSN